MENTVKILDTERRVQIVDMAFGARFTRAPDSHLKCMRVPGGYAHLGSGALFSIPECIREAPNMFGDRIEFLGSDTVQDDLGYSGTVIGYTSPRSLSSINTGVLFLFKESEGDAEGVGDPEWPAVAIRTDEYTYVYLRSGVAYPVGDYPDATVLPLGRGTKVEIKVGGEG